MLGMSQYMQKGKYDDCTCLRNYCDGSARLLGKGFFCGRVSRDWTCGGCKTEAFLPLSLYQSYRQIQVLSKCKEVIEGLPHLFLWLTEFPFYYYVYIVHQCTDIRILFSPLWNCQGWFLVAVVVLVDSVSLRLGKSTVCCGKSLAD